MARYLLSVYQPDGTVPAPEVLDPIMRNVEEVNAEMRQAGAWVCACGLHPPQEAAVVRRSGEEVLTVYGPYTEGTEHLGGFTVIEAPDLDAALGWGRKLTRATTLPIEVRRLQDARRS